MTAHEIYEALVLWPAYVALHERLGGDPRTADPRDLIGKVAGCGHRVAAAVITAHALTGELVDGELVLDELLELAAAARRPRYGNEIRPTFLAEILGFPVNEGAGS